MKIKHIALAAAMVASAASANAGLNIDTSFSNNDSMFINIWDATGSFTKDLGVSFGTFGTAAAAANPGDFVSLNLANDVAFQAFIAGRSTFSWDIIGVNTVSNYSSISTTNGTAALATAPLNTGMKTGTTNILNYMGAINGGILTPGSLVTNGTDSLYTSSNTAPTYVTANASASTGLFVSNSAIIGTQANNSFATGLGLLREVGAATGTSRATQTYFTGASAYIDSADVVHVGFAVAAVPEPESLAMLLAGMGLVGTIARRRNRKTV